MFSRRDFLRVSSLLGGGVVLSTALSGRSVLAQQPALSAATFAHGVASGDPLSDGMILWTRATPDGAPTSLTLFWELGLDDAFREVLRSGTVEATAERDYTVKIDVRELEPGETYYYRFRSASAESGVGRARTLPVAGVAAVKLAVLSCSNYPAGYFHAYREASRLDDLDAFVHLGDYIYEYGANGYATERAQALGRLLPDSNAGELYTLEDYRRRYALYRSDDDLQAMHAAAPCIAVWDDHEVANDTWREGAENHSPDEGDFDARKLAAVQAWHEWLPVRPPAGVPSEQIYRSFDFGGLLALHMLDTRIIARDRQLDYADYRDPETGQMNAEDFSADLSRTDRSLLGDSQLAWLGAQLAGSDATWQVLGQQVLMGRMFMPAEVLGAESYSDIPARLEALTVLKSRLLAGESLSQQDLARLQRVTPYNLDAWDGYPAEREKLYALAQRSGKRIVSLAGDTHNAWHSRLTDRNGNAVGVELATSSVTSPGMEVYFQMNADTAARLAEGLTLLIDDLQYCNLHQRGYLTVTATASDLQAEWTFIDSVHTREYRVAGVHRDVFTA